MAFIKDVETKYGVTASYHKITQLNIDWLHRSAELIAGSFFNRAARDNQAAVLISTTYYFSGNSFPFTIGGNNLREGYLAIKTYDMDGMLHDAQDDI